MIYEIIDLFYEKTKFRSIKTKTLIENYLDKILK